jgi:hypothetical protein
MEKNQTGRPASYQKLTMEQKRAVANRGRKHGDVTKVSKRTGFALSTVSEVLSGKYRNPRIVNAAFDIARGRKGAMNMA